MELGDVPEWDDELLSAEQVARRLGVGLVTVYRWCRQGRLTCFKLGKAWRIRRAALEAFLRRAERSRTGIDDLTARRRSGSST